MKRRWLTGIVTVFALFILMIPVYGMAPVETDKPCTVTIEGYPGDGGHFYLYKIADVDETMAYTLTSDFEQFKDKIINVLDPDEWPVIAETLSNYVSDGSIVASYEGDYSGDETTGRLVFSNIETGLYLILSDPVEVPRKASDPPNVEKRQYWTTPMIITAPNAVIPESGSHNTADIEEWEYEFSLIPKYDCKVITYEDVDYKVVKQWQDSDLEKRPRSVTVNLLKDGKVQEQVVLDQSNNWNYSWTGLDDGSVWTVQEVNIPTGYTVTITKNQTIFTIKNAKPPNTGDTPVSKTPMITMIVSGMIALVCGIILLRDRKKGAE